MCAITATLILSSRKGTLKKQQSSKQKTQAFHFSVEGDNYF